MCTFGWLRSVLSTNTYCHDSILLHRIKLSINFSIDQEIRVPFNYVQLLLERDPNLTNRVKDLIRVKRKMISTNAMKFRTFR